MSRNKKERTTQSSHKTRTVLHKLSPTRLVSWFLLALGLIALALSIIYASSILAFIGLGLTFWGALTLYIASEKYVKQTLLDSTITSSLANLNQILTELKYQGKAIYLPPKYLKDFETSKVYISKNKNTKLPTPEEIQQQDKIFLKNPEAALIIPPGFSLSKLFEKTLGTTFTKVDSEYIQQNLPKLFIEDLEIAEDLEIRIEPHKVARKIADSASVTQLKNDIIHVKITNSIYKDMCEEARKLPHTCGTIGCPLCSAIACALTKATGKPIIIEKIQSSEDDKIIEANYRVLETTEPQEQAEKASAEAAEVIGPHSGRLSKVASLFLIAFGSTILAWVGWLTWYDKTMGKGLGLIFFGSRAGETISLGIGMKVIYYFLIGLALLLSGSVILLRRRRRKV